MVGLIFKLGRQTTNVLDKGSIELIVPLSLQKTLVNVSRNIAGLDSGIIIYYALYILIALLIYMLIPYFYILNSSMILLIILGLYIDLNKQLNNPPYPHSFVGLPLQSCFGKLKHISEVIPNVNDLTSLKKQVSKNSGESSEEDFSTTLEDLYLERTFKNRSADIKKTSIEEDIPSKDDADRFKKSLKDN